MKRYAKFSHPAQRYGLVVVLTMLLLLLAGVMAQAGTLHNEGVLSQGEFTLIGRSNSGGGVLSQGDFTLSGIIGQPEAQALTLSQGDYTLAGGLMVGLSATTDNPKVYLPLILQE